ncbi:hypothetical protein CVT25_007296 [Psilocybe cyanescens]|uniref:Aminoglycoside phosphotransferase domain-containing protein n=1 Tax=Psilocybe cyanescens TaxID=93625 RepID=A0A409XP68_PSICY|nr:hypothetical protein CVT25_007296 [Psilocybe cyanescens]
MVRVNEPTSPSNQRNTPTTLLQPAFAATKPAFIVMPKQVPSQPQPLPSISWMQKLVKSLLSVFPKALKPHLFEMLVKTSSFIGWSPYHNIFCLPFKLVMKTTDRAVEADALRFVASLRGIDAPTLIDFSSAPGKTYILSTWIDGDCVSDIWERLTLLDKEMIVQDMKSQYSAMRQETSTRDHVICSASGVSIEDPRVPWLEELPDATFSSSRQFMEQVWVGLNNDRTPRPLYQMLIPLIQRDTPIVFTHGDALPKNIILPGGLELYRRGHSRLCIIDWEYAGWMPEPWEAIKATWLVSDRDEEEWYRMMREVFPDQCEVLDAEWEWRTQLRITIL